MGLELESTSTGVLRPNDCATSAGFIENNSNVGNHKIHSLILDALIVAEALPFLYADYMLALSVPTV